MIEKLVFWEGAVETLGYFSRQIEEYFIEKGYRTYFVKHDDMEESMRGLNAFAEKGKTAFITFNFIGLSGEQCCEAGGMTIWEKWDIPCYCIMVDHPFYYYKQLCRGLPNLTTFCVDRTHVEYMHRFHPRIACYFLPLAGNCLYKGDVGIPYAKRKYEISFIANYVPLEDLQKHLMTQPKEYFDLYMEMIEDLKADPKQTVDAVMEKFIKRELPETTDEELAGAEAGIMIIDLYIRSLYRIAVIRALTDAGLKVHVFGKDWEKLECRKKENLIVNGKMLTSAECVEVIRNTKIALNVMPWFKDGAHDRIFTAMLNGAVSLTDDSIYLREILSDKENVMFYELPQPEGIAGDVNGKGEAVAEVAKYLLEHEEVAEEITTKAYAYAEKNHRWKMRGAYLEQFLGLDE